MCCHKLSTFRPPYLITLSKSLQPQLPRILYARHINAAPRIMADSTATSNDADAAAQRAAEQARLRKERREAKIKAGGSARLEKITGVGGRVTGGSYANYTSF